jgi:hypothetical protein
LLAAAALLAPAALAKSPPKPDFDRVDHGRPKDALDLCPKFGSSAEIRKIAAGLKGAAPLLTIAAIDRWVQGHFAYDADAAYAWRTFAQMKKDATYGGCADHAVLFGSLTRAAGIPTVFVKTMDCDWIRAFVKGAEPETWSGHCFLEVHLDGRWALLDASAMRLYRDYDPSMRILPGPRYAYDKGHDPYAMVKSMRWELWKAQTRAYFRDFDLTKLPVAGGISVSAMPRRVFVTANGPYWKWLHARCQALGLPRGAYRSFNHKFDEELRAARGHLLVITSLGGSPVLPPKHHAAYLPLQPDAIAKALKQQAFGSAEKVAGDGTRVVLLYARDGDGMKAAIEAFTFPGP